MKTAFWEGDVLFIRIGLEGKVVEISRRCEESGEVSTEFSVVNRKRGIRNEVVERKTSLRDKNLRNLLRMEMNNSYDTLRMLRTEATCS